MGGKLVPTYDDATSGLGGWWILDKPELHLDQQILIPDLAGRKQERMPVLPEIAYFELTPDRVRGILSPSTVQVDRVDRLPIYAAYCVAHVRFEDIAARHGSFRPSKQERAIYLHLASRPAATLKAIWGQ